MTNLDTYAGYGKEVGARLTDQPLLIMLTRRLGASQQELFNYITDFTKLSEWIPGCTKSWSDDTNAEVPGQVGAVRIIASVVGSPTREIVKAYEAPRMLAYSATDKSLMGMATDHLSVLTVDPHPDGGSVFCWLAYAKRPEGRIMRAVGDKVFNIAIKGGTKTLEKKFPVA